jgi:enamine deaminase RidA (YjgF/YER057c/UK114 family)
VNRRVLQPPDWPRPRGYANGILAHGRLVFLAGQVGWNADGAFESDDLVDQTRQALQNIAAVLLEAGAQPRHIVRMTWYLIDLAAYRSELRRIGEVYRSIMGSHYPVMSVVEVRALMEARALVEIEATAVVDD